MTGQPTEIKMTCIKHIPNIQQTVLKKSLQKTVHNLEKESIDSAHDIWYVGMHVRIFFFPNLHKLCKNKQRVIFMKQPLTIIYNLHLYIYLSIVFIHKSF